ncbi:MAG: hypothetical protein U9P72_07350 [Campylobacterota bacterium]|nr:hypothetical protein [Campylobacterota bacterium]
MHNIALKVNNNAYEHLIYFLSNLKDDVEVIKDEIVSQSTEDDELTQELLSRMDDLKNGKAKILTRDEIFDAI